MDFMARMSSVLKKADKLNLSLSPFIQYKSMG